MCNCCEISLVPKPMLLKATISPLWNWLMGPGIFFFNNDKLLLIIEKLFTVQLPSHLINKLLWQVIRQSNTTVPCFFFIFKEITIAFINQTIFKPWIINKIKVYVIKEKVAWSHNSISVKNMRNVIVYYIFFMINKLFIIEKYNLSH